MPTLEIKTFSCIDEATLTLNDLTVIIGPQASGKSLICKLNYFFNDVIDDIPRYVEECRSLELIKSRVLEEFQDWFSQSSWGPKAFSLDYTSGPIGIRISRGRSKGSGPKAKISFSVALDDAIESVLAAFEKNAVSNTGKPEEDFDSYFRIQHLLSKAFERAVGKHGSEYQLYVPAGRSFFTSVGKIVTAFEDRSLLDPVVTRFGKLITNLREGHLFEQMRRYDPVLKTLEALIDGNIVQERGKQMLNTPDGRSVPFSALSSGQQELLPLLFALRFSLLRSAPGVLYIEEPEAHLFPLAQTELVEMFVRIANRHRRATSKRDVNQRKVVLTTHSPYVLAKLNNLVKAGSLGVGCPPERRKELEKIVPADAWVRPKSLSAFAIFSRKLTPILDEYGLIDGGYIDSVSADTGTEFDDLLTFEYRQ